MKYAVGPISTLHLDNPRVYQILMLLSEPANGVLVQSEAELEAYREYLQALLDTNNSSYPEEEKATIDGDANRDRNWDITIGGRVLINIKVRSLPKEYVSDKALEWIYKGGGTPNRADAMLLLTVLSSSGTTTVEKHLAADQLKELICILMPE